MELSRVLPVVIVGAAVALAGCESKTVEPKEQTGGSAGNESGAAPSGEASGGGQSLQGAANEAAGALNKLVEGGKEKAVESARQGLEAAKAKFEELKARAAAVAEEKRPAFDKAVSEIETQLGGVQTKLEELVKAGADAWQSLATEVGEGVSKVTEAINAARTEFGGQ